MSPFDPQVLAHLTDARLRPVWDTLRRRLEGNGIQATGRVTFELDDAAADLLGGVLGRRTRPGRRVHDLAQLDTDLRRSAAGRGLVAVVEAVTGPLVDRRAVRVGREDEWAAVWDGFGARALALGLEGWLDPWAEALQRTGIVTRLGPVTATLTLDRFLDVLARLDPATPVSRAVLAGEVTGNAHALDDGHTLPALVLRAVALREGHEPPRTVEQRRGLWESVGVLPDDVSGTAMVWNLVPPGAGPWAAVMAARRDLQLVTHLTSRELSGPHARGPLVDPGTIVWACENPQVLQAAADAGTDAVVTCSSGNPSLAWWTLLTRLLSDGARVRYHGDFDWPGVRIARRTFAAGADPWRFGADDYLAQVPTASLPLTGAEEDTPWDVDLRAAMAARGVAVHEESLLPLLLKDLEG